MIAKMSIITKIKNRGITEFMKILTPIVAVKERKLIKKYSSTTLKHQPIFIIGAPRTGSTILYQILTNCFDILYIDNTVDIWHRNFFFGFQKSHKIYGNTSHNSFTSEFGITSLSGGHAPAESGDFWYRWLPRNKHFIDFKEIGDTSKQEIYNNIVSVINYYNKPLLFKNLNAGQRLRMIKEIFPNAKFIYVKRHMLFTAQSILTAKRKTGVADNQFWSIMPKNVEELKTLPWAEQIVKQIYFLELQIEEDSSLFKDVLIIQYQDILKNTKEVIEDVQQFASLDYRTDYAEPIIKGGDYQSINDNDFKKLKSEIKNLINEQ